jgi:ATP-dependent Clp protease protease subunit
MAASDKRDKNEAPSGDLAVVGDLDDCEADVIAKLLELPDGSECTLYIDSGGGRVYSALAIMSLMLMKRLRTTAIVLGSCSSAAIMVLAACRRRIAMPYSVFQFHPVRWESGEDIDRTEAEEWARHFGKLEQECDEIIARLFGVELSMVEGWSKQSRYLTGRELAEHGLVELLDPMKGGRTRPHVRS